MVGFCGVVGKPENNIDRMIDKLIYLGEEKVQTYTDNNLKIGSVSFKNSKENQPACTKDDSMIWVWGQIYGFEGENGYSTKNNTELTDAEYCEALYNKYGIEFISGLNGEFAGMIYDRDEEVISLFTDRLSTHPIFFTRSEDEELVFSTHIQSIPLYPSVKSRFELKYLYHFFTFERVLGTKTVLKNVNQLHPASMLSYDVKTNKLDLETYWYPKHIPKNRAYPDMISEFIEVFKDLIKDRIYEDLTYGLLLSGGSDSRLILGTIKDVYPDIDITCYHMNEWRNKEARVAKEVAKTCDADFEFLKRKKDYLNNLLDYSSPLSIFDGWFDQAHSLGFKDKIRKEVDVLLNGNWAGTIVKKAHVPKNSLKIPILGENIYLPFYCDFSSLNDLNELLLTGYGATARDGKIPKYISTVNKQKIKNSLKKECKKDNDYVYYHGIKYPSIQDFFYTSSMFFYPITNEQSYFGFYTESNVITPNYPFLDNRVIDFINTVPSDVFLRKNIINSSIKKLNQNLAEIKHANTDIPIKYNELFHFIKGQYNTAKSKLFPYEKWHGSWGNREEIIRNYDFVGEKIEERKNLIRHYSFLDFDRIKDCYSNHIKGKNNSNQLFALLTFIENPITEYLVNK